MKKAKSSPGGNGASYGVTTGKTVGEFFCHLMDKQRSDRRSDDELGKMMDEEFPNRQRKDGFTRDIRSYRCRYNNGVWANQNELAPDFKVPKYIKGKPQTTHPGPRAKYEDPT